MFQVLAPMYRFGQRDFSFCIFSPLLCFALGSADPVLVTGRATLLDLGPFIPTSGPSYSGLVSLRFGQLTKFPSRCLTLSLAITISTSSLYFARRLTQLGPFCLCLLPTNPTVVFSNHFPDINLVIQTLSW